MLSLSHIHHLLQAAFARLKTLIMNRSALHGGLHKSLVNVGDTAGWEKDVDGNTAGWDKDDDDDGNTAGWDKDDDDDADCGPSRAFKYQKVCGVLNIV